MGINGVTVCVYIYIFPTNGLRNGELVFFHLELWAPTYTW